MNEETRAGRAEVPPPRRRWWVTAVVLVLVLASGAGLYWMLRPEAEPVALAEAVGVQSAVAQEGDSLQVIVQWQLSLAPAAGRAESLRVEVQVDSADATAARIRTHLGTRQQDTVYLPAPLPGETAEGLSCVAAQHRTMISRESCTPWRYVRPLAQVPGPPAPAPRGAAPRAGAPAAGPARIVVQPSGLQVDPDVGGRCAAWQRRNPTASVWVDVNRTAVPACMGPNRRPTVAQFCAFAELADGRRVKTANSANIPYCDRLFRAWARERLS